MFIYILVCPELGPIETINNVMSTMRETRHYKLVAQLSSKLGVSVNRAKYFKICTNKYYFRIFSSFIPPQDPHSKYLISLVNNTGENLVLNA